MLSAHHMCVCTHLPTCMHTHTHFSLIQAAKSACWVEVWITQTSGAETSRDGLPEDNWIIRNSTSLKSRFCVTVSNKSNQSMKVIKHIFDIIQDPADPHTFSLAFIKVVFVQPLNFAWWIVCYQASQCWWFVTRTLVVRFEWVRGWHKHIVRVSFIVLDAQVGSNLQTSIRVVEESLSKTPHRFAELLLRSWPSVMWRWGVGPVNREYPYA